MLARTTEGRGLLAVVMERLSSALGVRGNSLGFRGVYVLR